MNTAITSRVPAAEYRAIDALNISALKELRRSPMHYQYRLHNPKESAVLTLGTAAHVAVLEPERFERDFAIWNRRTDSGRMAPRTGKHWDEFCMIEARGRTVLTEDEFDTTRAIQAAVRTDPIARRYLESGEPEVVLTWERSQRACKGRIDWLTKIDGQTIIVGLKTARDCRGFKFGNQVAQLGYHLQFAYYFDGYVAITGETPKMCEIVVESEPPHPVVVYWIPSDVIEQGRDEYQELINQLEECEATNSWPGPALVEQVLTLPTWCYPAQHELSDVGLE